MPNPKLPPPPPEVRRVVTLDACAPRFARAVEYTIDEMFRLGWKCQVYESLRTNERQKWLYGFGRDYNDGRGIVTKATNGFRSWHFYGLAVDIVQLDATPWDAPKGFWADLGRIGASRGLTWGGKWKQLDLPHLQWGKCRTAPSYKSKQLFLQGGNRAVWEAVGAL